MAPRVKRRGTVIVPSFLVGKVVQNVGRRLAFGFLEVKAVELEGLLACLPARVRFYVSLRFLWGMDDGELARSLGRTSLRTPTVP